jgi:hypothetical protein
MLMRLKLAVAVALRIQAGWAAARWSQQQLGEEPQIGQLFAGGHAGEIEEFPADGGWPQHPAGLFDGGLGGLSGHGAVAGYGGMAVAPGQAGRPLRVGEADNRLPSPATTLGEPR